MNVFNKTFVVTTATLIALGGAAFAAGHATEVNVTAARLDVSLDTNGDGDVSDNEIIRGNKAIFDTNSDGAIDATERGAAEVMIAAQ